MTGANLRGHTILSWINRTGIDLDEDENGDEDDGSAGFAWLKKDVKSREVEDLKLGGGTGSKTIGIRFQWKCPFRGTQSIAWAYRIVVEVWYSGPIEGEVRRGKDGTIGRVLAAGKRKGGKEIEPTVDEEGFPYPSCGCGIIPTLSAGTEPRQSHEGLSSAIAPPSSIFFNR